MLGGGHVSAAAKTPPKKFSSRVARPEVTKCEGVVWDAPGCVGVLSRML